MGDYNSSDDDLYYCEESEYNDDDDFGDSLEGFQAGDNEVISAGKLCSSIKVIANDSVLAAQNEDLRRVMDFLFLNEQNARTLLIHYRWDVDKVLAVFVECGKERLFAEAGVVEHYHIFGPQISSVVTCNICYDDVSANEVTTMDCGHYFCNECWTEHFIVKINEGQSRRIRCMAHGCTAICDEVIIRNLVIARDTELAVKFGRFLVESYIEDNRRVKWCPSVPHCGNALQIEEDEVCEVECACGLQFCFSCSLDAHSPCSCQMWELWSRKRTDVTLTVNWMTIHTKPCPKCQKVVEKNGGCNLVFCICGQAFCWLCGAATGRQHTWTTIVGHSCGRYKEVHEKNSRRAKRDLDRYTHYHNRFKAHADSSELESELKKTIDHSIILMEQRESQLKDFSWITNGLNKLIRYRRVLSCSYPFAYCMFDNDFFKDEMTENERVIKQNLFEDLQQQFEGIVEKLSMALAEQFDELSGDDIVEIRIRIIEVSATADNLCKNMYEYIETDLLGSLKRSVHLISPYKPKGVEKALTCPSELDSKALEKISITS